MQFISQESTHAGQNSELYLSAHGHLPGILWYVKAKLVLSSDLISNTLTAIKISFRAQQEIEPKFVGRGHV